MNYFLLILLIFFFIFVAIYNEQIKKLFTIFADKMQQASNLSCKDLNINFVNPLDINTIQNQNIGNQLYSAEQNKAYENLVGNKNLFISEREKFITAELIKSKLPPARCIDALKETLAKMMLINNFLLIDKVIFQQQISLLGYLNINYFAEKEDLKNFYDDWKANSEPHIIKDYLKYVPISLDKFIGFLIDSQLICITSEHKYNITSFGKEFLSYLIKIGRKI
ncbi:MAG: hypothetical protein M1561_04455 [Gammaproteobacteria bacterium]|nr:hypothetical protein [Gammaproteobacteria bacterium]